MEMMFEYKSSPVPDAKFERMMEIIRRDLVRQLFRKNLKDQKNAGHPLSSSKEVSVA
jgi:hypothetical protein